MNRYLVRSKSNSSLSESVRRCLNMYVIAAGASGFAALAVASPAEAEIIYTAAHVKLTPNHKFHLDLNHDGIKDFELDDIASGSSAFLEIHALQLGNALLQAKTDCNPSVGVAALQAGMPIGKGQVFYGGLYCMAQKISEGSFGSWPSVRNRFLGLEFVIQGKKHFGWARLSVSRAPYVATLTGYAYETIPGKSIKAGQTHANADDATNQNPRVAASLTNPIPDLPQAGSLGLLALGAQGVRRSRRTSSD